MIWNWNCQILLDIATYLSHERTKIVQRLDALLCFPKLHYPGAVTAQLVERRDSDQKVAGSGLILELPIRRCVFEKNT